mmetsp:Transcript_68453/g.164370  ORF Transcript_68453/g.164370 Transcript_68453/m.164370 type:complete len:299 (+) Transcript_68453:81-977(+)
MSIGSVGPGSAWDECRKALLKACEDGSLDKALLEIKAGKVHEDREFESTSLEAGSQADGGLAAAAAAGDAAACQEILSRGLTGPNAYGPDGTSPLFAASLWGHAEVVKVLLGARADPCQANRSRAGPSPLHAAALQEHGKVCMMLLGAKADPNTCDGSNISAADYASCSEAVWPQFAAVGCVRVPKEELVERGVIRRVSEALEEELRTAPPKKAPLAGVLPEYSRPGSAYVFSGQHPPRPGSAMPKSLPSGRRQSGPGSARSRPTTQQTIDILGETAPDNRGAASDGTRSAGLRSLGL